MIKFEDISLAFGEKKVFSGFSFEVAKNDKVVLSGRSGIGKSSLFALLLGFVRPQKGTVSFDGVVVNEHTVWDMRRKISFVDQDVSLGEQKLRDWFSFVRDIRSDASFDPGSERLKELMDLFEMKLEMLDEDISDLSGGERQRVAIIVSILLGRKVFLLDEITSALDKNLKNKVVDIFTKREDWTVVCISHEAVWLNNPFVRIFDLGARRWKQ